MKSARLNEEETSDDIYYNGQLSPVNFDEEIESDSEILNSEIEVNEIEVSEKEYNYSFFNPLKKPMAIIKPFNFKNKKV